jgi:hypothetical protein
LSITTGTATIAVTGQVTANSAANITVADTAGYYTGTNVETVLAEISDTPSTTARSLLELATDAETLALTDTARAATPQELLARPPTARAERCTP